MARRMIDLVKRPNFGVIHDAGNMHITGDSYGEESVKLLGDRIFHVHVKDMVKARRPTRRLMTIRPAGSNARH